LRAWNRSIRLTDVAAFLGRLGVGTIGRGIIPYHYRFGFTISDQEIQPQGGRIDPE